VIAVLGAGRGNLQRVLSPQVVEVEGDPFAKREVDPTGVVDEEAQRFLARLLKRDQIKLGIELTELLLNVLLEVCHTVEAVKKVGQAHFEYCGETKKL
jgi:hypothetical protein